MKQTLRRLLPLIVVLLGVVAHAQEPVIRPVVSKPKMIRFTEAIAKAEGFGIRRAIPTRYHNPGDLKCNPRTAKFKFEGMKGVGKGGHTIFKNDAAGWTALRTQVQLILDGKSHNFNKDMTINQMAHVYAKNWRQWANYVSKELGVPPTTTLADFFDLPVEPPVLNIPPSTDTLAFLVNTPPVIPPVPPSTN